MFRGNLRRSGEYQSRIKPPLTLAWKTYIANVMASPVISNSVVYCGSHYGKFYAIDVNTGEEIWEFQTDDLISSSAAVSKGIVYFGSCDNKIYAIDAQSGEKIWEFDTEENVESSPAVYNGVVYCGSDMDWGSGKGKVYALDGKTGANIWEIELAGTVQSFAITAEKVFGLASHELRAFDYQCGKKIWSSGPGDRMNPEFSGNPSIGESIVCCAVKRGFKKWKSGRLYTFDISTGAKIWEFKTSEQIWSSPAIYGNRVYFGSDEGKLYALDARKGTEIWKFQMGDIVRSCPIVSNGVVYCGSLDKKIYGLDAKTGKKLWEYETGGEIWSSPTISNDMLFIGSGDGYLYAFKKLE
jgi:outer membrane protein assembly factor BamB